MKENSTSFIALMRFSAISSIKVGELLLDGCFVLWRYRIFTATISCCHILVGLALITVVDLYGCVSSGIITID